MKSGDSLKVRKDSLKVQQQKTDTKVFNQHVNTKTYGSTFYPTLLATNVDHGFYDITMEACQSILPSNIMRKAAFDNNKNVANFRFYEHKGVVLPSEQLTVNLPPLSSADSVKVQSSDSLPAAKIDSLALRPAIDSLPKINFASADFNFGDIDSSLLDRFGLQEYVSRDSYVLLESHPELVYGRFSAKVQLVNPARVGEAKPRETQNLGFVSFVVLTIGIILFITSLKFQFKNALSIIQSFISIREARKSYQNRSLSFKRFALFSTIFYVLTFTVFSILIAQRFAGNFVREFGILLSYFVFFLAILSLFFAKVFSWNVLGNISRNSELFSELKYNHLIFYTSFALAIFPLLVVASYADAVVSKVFIYLSIYLVIILLVQYIVRSLRLFLSYRVSFFFWFLYFCTLEMLPIAVALYLLQ